MTDRLTFAATVTSEGRRLRGAVKLAGSRTWRNGEWLEIDPAAIVKADASRAIATFEHDDSKLLAAMSNGSLHLRRTDEGIEYETDELPNTSYANDALELVRLGLVTGTSFEIEGPRSEFTTDPDGTRVRRYTAIKSLRAVNPVRDPAFTESMTSAFSQKESTVSEPIETPPVETPPPVVTFAKVEDDKSETYRAAEAFARKQTLTDLAAAMSANLTGEWTAAKADAHAAFSAVYDERKAAEESAKETFERIQLAQAMREGRIPKAPESGLVESDDYKQAFSRYIRHGDLKIMEQFAQSISGTGAEGGYTVPTDFRQKIVETQAAFGGIQQLADVIETGDGRTLPWPTNNDTANSAVVASEGSAPGSAGADLVFGEVNLGAFSIAASGASNAPLKVSWELVQDSAFNIEAFVAKKLGERLGRKAAAYYATGVGTTEPFGALAKTPDTMTATKVRAATVEHIFQINEAYRNSGEAGFVMSDTILSRVWNSVDLNGRPMFIPSQSPAERVAGTLYGFPVRLDQGAGTLVAFGDLRQGYVIRRVRDIQVVVDPYNNTATRQTGYHAWMRTDAAVQDSAAYSVSDWTSVTADATA